MFLRGLFRSGQVGVVAYPKRPSHVSQVGSEQVGLAQVGSTQVGSAQVGLAQIGLAQVGSAQVGSAQVGLAQVGSAQVGSAQVGFVQVGFVQVGPSQVGIAQVGSGAHARVRQPCGVSGQDGCEVGFGHDVSPSEDVIIIIHPLLFVKRFYATFFQPF